MSEPFKVIDGIEVFLTPEGKFTAEIKGKQVQRASLSALKTQIRKVLTPLTVQHLYSPWRFIKRNEMQIIEFMPTGKARKISLALCDYYDTLYLCNEEEIEKLDQLIAKQEIIEKEWESLVDNLERVTDRNFKEIVKRNQQEAKD